MPHNLSPLCHNRRPGSTPATAYTHPCLASSLCSSNSCRRRARCQDRKHCNCAADIYCNNRQFHIETIPSSCGVVGYHVCFTSPCGIAQGPRFDSVREQPFGSPFFVHVQTLFYLHYCLRTLRHGPLPNAHVTLTGCVKISCPFIPLIASCASVLLANSTSA